MMDRDGYCALDGSGLGETRGKDYIHGEESVTGGEDDELAGSGWVMRRLRLPLLWSTLVMPHYAIPSVFAAMPGRSSFTTEYTALPIGFMLRVAAMLHYRT
jgi:hypothetical protein